MDPKELLALMGYTDAPAPTPGPFDQAISGPSDAYLNSQVAAPQPQVDAVSGTDGYEVPMPQPGSGGVDFQPKTYDFGNQGAKQMEYDNMGNLYELLPGGKGSVGVSQAKSGYSSAKMGEIEAGPMGSEKMKKGEAGLWQQTQNSYAPLVGRMEQANAAQLQSYDESGQAEADQVMAKAEGMGKISSLRERHASELKLLNESTLIAKQQAMDNYRQKLLEIPTVNPSALWDEAGSFGQFQMAAAAFVHDMLGVKGIKTSAMDTINNAIKNKIDAQIANINTKKQVAAGFKDLYEMTVAESGSQMEVQAKMHGYMLKAMEAGIDAEMGKVDSNVARAKHQQAKMAIRQAQLKNMAEVDEHMRSNFDKAAGRQIQIRGQNLQASMSRESNATQLRIAELRNKAETAASLPPPIYDTSKSGKGAAKWRVKAQYAKDGELQRGIINKTVLTNKAVEGFRELQDLQKQIDGSPPAIAGRLRSELARREEALRSTVVSAMVLDTSGKAATDKEYDRIAATVPAQGWFSNGNNRKIIADRVKGKLTEMNDLLKQTTDDIKEGDPDFGKFAAQNVYGDAEGLEAQMTKDGTDVHVQGAAETLFKVARSPDAIETILPENNAQYQDFTKPYWDAYRKDTDSSGKTDNRYKNVPGARHWANDLPTKGFDAVRELTEDASGNDPDALAKLQQLASEELTTSGSDEQFTIDANVRDYARWFLKKLGDVDPGTNRPRSFGDGKD